MNFCPNCGKRLDGSEQFCPLCGDVIPQGAHVNPSENEHADTHSMYLEKTRKRMKPVARIVLAVLVLILISVGVLIGLNRDFTKSPYRINKEIESVVMLNCYDRFDNLCATGSGFIAYDDSTIITNYHVIDRMSKVLVSTNEDIVYEVDCITAYDVAKDIAILHTESPTGLKPLTLGNSAEAMKGSNIAAIGSPLGNKNTISTGVLSGRYYDSALDLSLLQFTAPISGGSSGGALFDSKGKVIGVTSASFIDAQNLNLAIPIEEAATLYGNRASPITMRECFENEYGRVAAKYYYESEYVPYTDLLKSGGGQNVITDMYLIYINSDESYDYFYSYPSEENAFGNLPSGDDSVPVICKLPKGKCTGGWSQIAGNAEYWIAPEGMSEKQRKEYTLSALLYMLETTEGSDMSSSDIQTGKDYCIEHGIAYHYELVFNSRYVYSYG